MFEKFGAMNLDELNKTAEGLKLEGDLEALILLAKENGLEKEDAEDYADGAVEMFTTPVEAALGKIKVEAEFLKVKDSTTLAGMTDLIRNTIIKDEALQIAAHDPDKCLDKCLGLLIRVASRSRYRLPEPIAKAAGIPAVYMGDITQEKAREIIKNYYGGRS